MDFLNRWTEILRLPTFVKTVIDHNRWLLVAVVLCMSLGGCLEFLQPKVVSPVTGQQVTKDELETDVETWAIDFKLRQDALDAELKKKELEFKKAFTQLS